MCGPPALIAATRSIWKRGRGARARAQRELPALRRSRGHRRRPGPLCAQRRRGLLRGRKPARAGRAGRTLALLRLPDGHLPHLHHAQAGRDGCATSAAACSRAPTPRTCSCASRCPQATSSSTSEQHPKPPRPTHGPKEKAHARRETAALTRADRGTRRRARRVARARDGRPRRAGPGLHPQAHQDPARTGDLRTGAAVRELPAAGLAGGRGRPVAVEDPRQHGDRPQRDARPVRLDRRPGSVQQRLRVGHRLPRRPVAPLPQLHPPHLHEHPRQGPRHRLRRSCG